MASGYRYLATPPLQIAPSSTSLCGLEQAIPRTESPGRLAIRNLDKPLPQHPKRRSSSIYSDDDSGVFGSDLRQSITPDQPTPELMAQCLRELDLDGKDQSTVEGLSLRENGERDNGMGIPSIETISPKSAARYHSSTEKSPAEEKTASPPAKESRHNEMMDTTSNEEIQSLKDSDTPERGRRRERTTRSSSLAVKIPWTSRRERNRNLKHNVWAEEYSRTVSRDRRSMLAAMERELTQESPVTAIWVAELPAEDRRLVPQMLSPSRKQGHERPASRCSNSSTDASDDSRGIRYSFRAYAKKYLDKSNGHTMVGRLAQKQTSGTSSSGSTIRTLHTSDDDCPHASVEEKQSKVYELRTSPRTPPPRPPPPAPLRIRPTIKTSTSVRKSSTKSIRSPAVPLSPYQLYGVKVFEEEARRDKARRKVERTTHIKSHHSMASLMERLRPVKKKPSHGSAVAVVSQAAPTVSAPVSAPAVPSPAITAAPPAIDGKEKSQSTPKSSIVPADTYRAPVSALERLSPLRRHRRRVQAEKWREAMKRQIAVVGNVSITAETFDFGLESAL